MCITKETKNTKSLPPLIAQQSTYKLIVPRNVEEKIRYLIRKFPSTEWSGVLFYKHQGTFENNDLVITCEDIFPMDLGTSGWTEFKMNEDVTAYMAENIELFDCEMGLVHSHHNMGAFFSSQDALMLQQEGNDTNCFVSLVVDTRGQYVARITRKVQSKSEVTVKNLGTSYEFFGEGPKNISENGKQVSKVVDKETIEYFDLEIERHVVENSLDYLDARFEEIQSRKNNKSKATSFIGSNSIGDDFFKSFDRKENKELDLFKSPYDSFKESDLEWMPDPKKIHKAVVNMITCSFIVCVDKFDLKQWVVKHINKVYKNIFGEYEDIKENEAFTQWKDFVVQFTLDHFDYENVADDYNWEIYESKVAQAIIDELSKFSDNAYIKAYMEELYYYITD